MKFRFILLFLSVTGLYACQKNNPKQPEEKPGTRTEIGTKVVIDQSYLTDNTKAVNSNYEKFAGVWKLSLFVCGTCGAPGPLTDTTEILTLRKNGQYEIIKSDTIHYTGNYRIRYDYRCGSSTLEKTFLFEDIASIEKAKNSGISFPVEMLSSTIDISNAVLTIAAPKCMVDMDGYRTYKKITK
ncbi:hypothetical protein [Niabella sp.]|uniref:hypothetical protein n=1 Tax=Niabella sp. TaxID=1962976 RepID=UPI00260B1E3D|nr:hypothetical protein [Niabella sp.]